MKNGLILFTAVLSVLPVVNTIAQTSAAHNVLSKSITAHPIPHGPSVMGIFEGRPPCNEIAKQLGFPVRPECTKIKWRLSLFKDPTTGQPSKYEFLGSFIPSEGNWKILKGTRLNADAIVYALELKKPGEYFYFFKGDDNVLFVLDENKDFRVGNEQFSYTLNRVELIPKVD
jgi:hypothetical protein